MALCMGTVLHDGIGLALPPERLASMPACMRYVERGPARRCGSADLRTEAAVPDGIGAALPSERAGRTKLRYKSAKCALARLQQQLSARPLPREVSQHQRHVLIGIRPLTLAVQKVLQQHCAVIAEEQLSQHLQTLHQICSTLRSSHAIVTLLSITNCMSCRVNMSAAFRCSVGTH